MRLLVYSYIFSVCFEPLLFFVVASRDISGVSGNISRLLQFFTLSLFFLFLVVGNKKFTINKRFLNPIHPYFRYYTIFFGIACISGVVGFFAGKYDLPFIYRVGERSGLAIFLNSQSIRPLFEYCIAFYYFFYFVVMPFFILKKESDIRLYIKVILNLFFISFVVGWVSVILSFIDIYLIPRQWAEWLEGEPRFVPYRYHGLAGEPRDAFVYLVFGGLVYYISRLLQGKKFPLFLFISILAAIGFTQSGSGILGVVFFFLLFPLLVSSKQNPRTLFTIIFLYSIGLSGVYFSIIYIPRIADYFDLALNVFYLIDTKKELPYNIMVQANNIYPLYSLYLDFQKGNFYPIFFGNGFGSASIVNNIFNKTRELDNPHSMVIRVVYETGFVGVSFFIYAFWSPVKSAISYFQKRDQKLILVATLLLIGCNLAHRSSTIYIFLGLIFSIYRMQSSKEMVANRE